MNFCDILEKRRTVRLFQQKKVEKEKIISMLNAARLASCAMNKQILRYAVISEKNMLKKVFDGTFWAANVKPHRTPVWGESSPYCFIAVYGPSERKAAYAKFDAGAAIMSMLFQACEAGLGCCWLGSFNQKEVKNLLNLADDSQIYALVAVGYPAEEPQYENINISDEQSYYLNTEKKLIVPKYTVAAITEFYED